MPSTKELRRRIRSVKNISQITKAMQMVAATKMRRAQNQALNGRPYSQTLQSAITELLPAIERRMNKLLQNNNSNKIAILLLSTDKSLCGALNANILRLTQQVCNAPHPTLSSKERETASSLRGDGTSTRQSQSIDFFTIGRKGRDFVVKTNKSLAADFENNDSVEYKKVKQTANILIQNFMEENYAEIYVLYPDFVSTLRQEPKLEKLLPISREELLKGLNIGNLANFPTRGEGVKDQWESVINPRESVDSFIFDTSKQQLLDFVLNHFVQQKIYQSMLETKASEHSARMIAMKNATDSAKELVSDLNLAYNRTRQEGITKELLEITSALAALE